LSREARGFIAATPFNSERSLTICLDFRRRPAYHAVKK
jgi:hypothetical protein